MSAGAADRENQGVGTRCELRILQQGYNEHGVPETKIVEDLGASPDIQSSGSVHAIVVKRHLTERNRFDKTMLTINSARILKVFREVIKSYPTVASDFSGPFDMETPFQMLYHYWEDLVAYKESTKDDDMSKHLDLLFEFMEAEMGTEKRRCETQIRKGQVSFSRLWTIFRPGELQVRFENGHPWLMRLEKTAYEETQIKGKYFEVHCTYTDFDGKDVGEAKHSFEIRQKRFFASDNPANITDLVVFPRKFVDGDETLEERLSRRGAEFLAYKKPCIRQYDGFAEHIEDPPPNFFHPNMGNFDPVWLPYTETGKVVVDRKTFQEENRLSEVAIKPNPEDVEKMLCPPFVYGFSLARKEWGRFYIACIGGVEWKKDSFESLVMKSSQKNLVKALVSSHDFSGDPRDRTKQKGKGLVVLLHGTPGSGKTLTAECAAEATEKALITTTMAEMNKYNVPWFFEEKLKKILQYAVTWKAIVLLDEADVFLEARKDRVADSADRNALVAVFLRLLEYFSGIVFLSTNRVRVFDAAMKSRIHLSIGYSPPDQELRRVLWTVSLKAVDKDQKNLNVEDAVPSLIQENLNGREITYAINTAQTLARHQGKPLELEHIRTVLGIRQDFEAALQEEKIRLGAVDEKHDSSEPAVRTGSLLGEVADE
ncbi:MAG: hypothetical protein Q9227_005024 [Pyrenula ochraceoflavens]